MFILTLKNSVKSLQLILNEFTLETHQAFSITAGAFTKARKKLKHTAYIELNDEVIDLYYKDDDIKRLKGFRVLTLDGSKITLPKSEDIKKEFGSKPIKNHTGKDLGDYSRATFQACYDVLNEIAVASILGHGSSYEVNLAEEMLPSFKPNDLLIFDRGYASYAFMAAMIKSEKEFIIRCPRSSLTAIQYMFSDDAPESAVISLDVPRKQTNKISEKKPSRQH